MQPFLIKQMCTSLGDPAVPILAVYLSEIKTYVHTKTRMQMFNVALHTTARNWNSANALQLVSDQQIGVFPKQDGSPHKERSLPESSTWMPIMANTVSGRNRPGVHLQQDRKGAKLTNGG